MPPPANERIMVYVRQVIILMFGFESLSVKSPKDRPGIFVVATLLKDSETLKSCFVFFLVT